MHFGIFGITEKPMTDCVSPYNNAGLISEKITSKHVENWRSRQPHCCLMGGDALTMKMVKWFFSGQNWLLQFAESLYTMQFSP